MHLKRFRGTSVREALAAAREELGPTALVLSTQLVPAQGLKGWFGERVVEVTAATDRGVSKKRPVEPPVESANRLADAPVGARVASTPDPAGSHVASRLAAMGLSRVFSAEVAARVPVSRRRGPTDAAIRHALEERLQWLAAADETPPPVQVFVGPPGAGKTTTVAKIAAQHRARRGSRLGLVAADGFRVGAVEQLRLYAEIIGVPFRVARSITELTDAVADSECPVLIDTAGRSPNDHEALDVFSVFAGRPQVRTHLVVPATTSPEAFARVVDAYAPANPTRVVFTKLDEADGIAPLIDLLRERDLVVSYLTAGQRVPEDLEPCTPAGLASRVLGDASVAAGGRA
jgi:flagellar biosynthesis protein FlhF